MINEPKQITVLIADDHKLYLDGLKALLDKEKDIKVLGEAKDGEELIGQGRQRYVPDVILTDLKMPGTDGVEAIKTIKQARASS